VFCVISGLAWGASSHARWVAYSAHEAHSSARNLPSRPGRLHEPLRDLLQQTLFTPDQEQQEEDILNNTEACTGL
jgi:hypothetical protein